MAYILRQNDRTAYDYKEIYVDNTLEIPGIDTTKCAPGSVVYDISTGDVYLLNNKKNWIKQ